MISGETLTARVFEATFQSLSLHFLPPIQPLSTRSPMPIPRRLRLVILLFAFFFSPTSACERSVDSHPSRLRLPPSRPVEGSPGSRPGSVMTCNRIHIHGVSRLRHPRKYAHSLKVRLSVAQVDNLFRIQTIELCFHQNASIGLGMCPPDEWQKLSKNSWVQSMSPYGYKILDMRMLPDPSRTIELSTEEEFMFHRIVFLVLGLIMMMMARFLSESVVFYYGGAMTLGIVVVILIVLYQGMRLLPTGRKSSIAIFMYSSVVGIGTFFLHYLSGLLRTILMEIGISEDMHNPLGILLLACLILAGAWFGYWGVRKLVLTEDGLVDSGVAYFVEWAIYILSAVMLLQSSLDTLFAAEVLGFAIIISAITKTFLRRLFRRIIKYIRRLRVQASPSKNSPQLSPVSGSGRPQARNLNLTSCSSPGLTNRRPRVPYEESYYSTFHNTPERRKLSKEEWEIITRKHTKQGLRELISSPDFNQWALANEGRIVVTPRQDRRHRKRRRFFGWF